MKSETKNIDYIKIRLIFATYTDIYNTNTYTYS